MAVRYANVSGGSEEVTFKFETGDEDLTLRVERDVEMVSSMGGSERDPDWTWTDPAGHDHDAKLGRTREITVTAYADDGDGYVDEWEETEYRCLDCDCPVIPGYRYRRAETRAIPTMERYYVNDAPVLRERYQEIVDELIAQHAAREAAEAVPDPWEELRSAVRDLGDVLLMQWRTAPILGKLLEWVERR